jgi:hypothetical protein
VSANRPDLPFPTVWPAHVVGPAPTVGATEPPVVAPGLPMRGDDPDFADLVDEWGRQSFPASDPPANW